MKYKLLVFGFLFTLGLLSLVGWKGGLGGKNYRMSIAWITESGNYSPGDYGRKIQFGGLSRFYKFHVPAGYEKSKPIPVVLVFHGGGGYPGVVRYQSGMDKVADQEGFIVVYPAGTHWWFKNRLLVWNAGIGCGYAKEKNIDDVGFVAALLDDLAKYFSIDRNRVYATGISNGALMCYTLAGELSDQIAAIAPIAAVRGADEFSPPPLKPVPVMHFHGLQDQDAPFHGGLGIGPTGTKFQAVPKAIQTWIDHNNCPSTPSKTERIGKAVLTQYGPGDNDSEVALWTIEDGGHTWPGGPVKQLGIGIGRGHVSQDIPASEIMWEFFKKHPKR